MSRTTNKQPPGGTVGARVRAAREVAGVKPESLARAADVAAERLGAIEADRSQPDRKELEALGRVLGRDPLELVLGPLEELPAQRLEEIRRFIEPPAPSRHLGRRKYVPPEKRPYLVANLRSRREAAGLSQNAVAQRVGLSNASVVTGHETLIGDRTPEAETLAKYAALYGCTVEDLLEPPPAVIVRAAAVTNLDTLPAAERLDFERRLHADLEAISKRLTTEYGEKVAEAARRLKKR